MSDVISLDEFKKKSQVPAAGTHYDRFCAARQAMLQAYVQWVQQPGTDAALVKDEAVATLRAIGSIPVYLEKTDKEVIDA